MFTYTICMNIAICSPDKSRERLTHAANAPGTGIAPAQAERLQQNASGFLSNNVQIIL